MSTTSDTGTAAVPAQRGVSRSPFLASRDGFAFHNSWPSQPAVVFKTPVREDRHRQRQGRPVRRHGVRGPRLLACRRDAACRTARRGHTSLQVPGEAHRRLVARAGGVAQYYQWMGLPDGDSDYSAFGRRIVVEQGLAWRTIRLQWPQIKKDLDRGVPSGLGLVTVASRKPEGPRLQPPGPGLRLRGQSRPRHRAGLRPEQRAERRRLDPLRPPVAHEADDASSTTSTWATRCGASSASPTPPRPHPPDRCRSS